MKNVVGILIVGVFVLLFSWNVIQKVGEIESENENESTEQLHETNSKSVRPATNFELPTLAGEMMELKDTRGKVTILNFWASWCGPCQIEAPHLQAFYEKHKEKVEILAVNITSKDVKKQVKTFVNEHQLTFPILLDQTGDVSMMYGAFTIPTTIFLND